MCVFGGGECCYNDRFIMECKEKIISEVLSDIYLTWFSVICLKINRHKTLHQS